MSILCCCGACKNNDATPQDYLPVIPGSRYVYSKTVFPSSNTAQIEDGGDGETLLRCYATTQASPGPGPTAIIRYSHQKPGRYQETVEVVADATTHSARIEVLPRDTARDGRYKALETIVWRWNTEKANPKSTKTYGVAWEDGCCETFLGGKQLNLTFLLLNPGLRQFEAPVDLKEGKSVTWVVETSTWDAPVATPAGHFGECFRVITTIPKDRIGDPNAPTTPGWKNTSFYARGVGLVKEEQSTLDGQVLYRMELVEYQIPNASRR